MSPGNVSRIEAAEIIYDADPQLRHPGRFARRAFADLAVSFRLSSRLLGLTLKARYRQSLLGYVWLLATPVAISAVWIFLHRSRIVDFGDTQVPYPLHVTSGVLLWTAFLRMLNAPLQQLQASRHVLSKIGFPWEALLLAGWGEVLVELAVFLGVISVLHLAYGLPFFPLLVAVPLVLALLALGGGIGMILAPLSILYDDIPRALSVATYLLFFLTPIIYPAPTEMPALSALLANPVAILLVSAREVMTSQPLSHPFAASVVLIGTLLLAGLGWTIFRLSVPHVVSKL